MDIGMLWYDDDKKRTLSEKVERAAQYYQSKYGRPATACYVNPGALANAPDHVGAVRLLPSRTVFPHHFWIGVAELQQEAAA